MSQEQAVQLVREAEMRLREANALLGVAAMDPGLTAGPRAATVAAPLEAASRLLDDVVTEFGTEPGRELRAPLRTNRRLLFRRPIASPVEDQAMKKTYSAHDFRKALATSTLDHRPALEGMVKVDDQDEGVLLFSSAGCERWTPIPLDLVLEVEHLGRARCKDHQHPRVRIHLKLPETPEARVLAGLLDAQAATRRIPNQGQDCGEDCGAEYQSCIGSCDPRDDGCYYGCKRWLFRCMQKCR